MNVAQAVNDFVNSEKMLLQHFSKASLSLSDTIRQVHLFSVSDLDKIPGEIEFIPYEKINGYGQIGRLQKAYNGIVFFYIIYKSQEIRDRTNALA